MIAAGLLGVVVAGWLVGIALTVAAWPVLLLIINGERDDA